VGARNLHGGVSEEHQTHFNLLANKINYRMNHHVYLDQINPPLRTMKSDRKRKLSVVKVMLQNQYCSFSSEILA